MPADLDTAINALAPQVRLDVRAYAEGMHRLLGDRLLSLVIYGEAVLLPELPREAAQAPSARVYNALMLPAFDLKVIDAIGRAGRSFARTAIAAPVVLTPEFLTRSLDTFPLELLEIQQRYVVLVGEDRVAGLNLDRTAVARQCERELKIILMRMHQHILGSGGREKHLAAMTPHAAEHLLRAVRGLLWLKGRSDCRTAAELVDAAGQAFRRELTGIRSALDRSQPPRWETFLALYSDVQALGAAADAL